MKSTFVATLTVAVALIAVPALAAEISNANRGFELGDTSLWEDFTAPATPFEAINDGTAFEGDFYGRISNTTAPSGAVVKQANLAAGLLEPNAEITVSFVARGVMEAGGVPFAELFSELDGGGTSKAEILGGGPLFFSTETDWQPFSFTTTLGPDVSGGVTLQFNAATGGASGSTSIFEFDDISIQTNVVPEPSTIALFSLGGLGAFVAWRRRRTA